MRCSAFLLTGVILLVPFQLFGGTGLGELLMVAEYSDRLFLAPLYERRKTRVADPRYSSGCHYIL